jgi:hypothetical protein
VAAAGTCAKENNRIKIFRTEKINVDYMQIQYGKLGVYG